jgi:hypothetical protein
MTKFLVALQSSGAIGSCLWEFVVYMIDCFMSCCTFLMLMDEMVHPFVDGEKLEVNLFMAFMCDFALLESEEPIDIVFKSLVEMVVRF